MTGRDRLFLAVLAVLFVGLSGLALAPSFQATGGQPSAAPTLSPAPPYVEGVLGSATNASPFGARSATDKALVSLLFRGLVRPGPGDSIVGDLATRWEVDPRGADWTFHLRPGLRWQDGQPLTAEDVAFTIGALSSPDYDGPAAASWREVTAAVIDPLTVRLTLATPLGGFLQAATQAIAPAHLLADEPPSQLASDSFGTEPVGSGPFRLAVLDATRAVLLPAQPPDGPVDVDATPNFATPVPSDSLATPRPELPNGAPAPYLGGIEFQFFDDAKALRAAWQRGVVNAVSGLPPADAAALGSEPGAHLLRYPSSTLLAVMLDLRARHATFLDPAVRRALLAAIDRDDLMATTLAGLGEAANGLIPPWSSEFDPNAATAVNFDPTAARKALSAAGWRQVPTSWIAKGAKDPLDLVLYSPEQEANPVAYEAAVSVAADWRAIGLKVTLEPLPASELLDEHLRTGAFQAAVVPLVIGLDPDLYPLLASSQTRANGSNVSGLQDPALDQLLVAARAPGTDDARRAAYSRLQQRLSSGLFILPLAFRDEVVVVRNELSGASVRPVGDSGDRFWDVLTWRLAESQTSG